MKSLNSENYNQGFLVDDELMAGVTEDPAQPGVFTAFVIQHTTGSYLGYQAFSDLQSALERINQIPDLGYLRGLEAAVGAVEKRAGARRGTAKRENAVLAAVRVYLNLKYGVKVAPRSVMGNGIYKEVGMALEAVREEKPAHGTGFHVNWGGIFSGAFVMLGLSLLFQLLGGGLGVPALRIMNPGFGTALGVAPLTGGVLFWGWIYNLVTLAFSFYVGGICSAKIARIQDSGQGALHGLTSWAVALIGLGLLSSLYSLTFYRLMMGAAGRSPVWFAFFSAIVTILSAISGGASGVLSRSMVVRDQGEERFRAA